MAYDLRTRHGHNMYDMASMMQKSIRRCDIEHASYAAYELYGNFTKYMWRRLLVISAEDVYGIMTKEIIALSEADEIVNKGRKGYDKDAIFLAKAVYLLCIARKNRDACYVACNFMIPDETLDESEIPHLSLEQIENMKLRDSDIPQWVFDCHTIRGKQNGKTDVDMTVTEQKALKPHQMGIFDNCSWERAYVDDRVHGRLSDKEWRQYEKYLQGKPFNPSKEMIEDDEE